MARDQFGLQEPGLSQKQEFDFLTAGTAENPIVVESDQQIPAVQRDPNAPASSSPESEFQVPEAGDANPMVQQDKDEFGLPEEKEAPEPQAPEASQEQVEQLIFGKYKSMEEAEKGYKEIVALQTRTAQARRMAERQASESSDYQARLEETLKQALPIIQQANAQQNQPPPQAQPDYWSDPTPQAQVPQGPVTPQQIQQLVDQQLSSRLDGLQQQAQEKAQQTRSVQEAEASIMGFYEKHPEVTVEGELDGQITETIHSLNEAWQKGGQKPLNVGNPDSLEIAYEASRSPELRAVLEMNPVYVDSEAGMQLARFQAALVRGEQPITQQVVQGTTSAVPSTPATGQRRPVTERASVGASPAQSDKPLDEFEQAVSEFRRNRTAGLSGSVFS